MQYLEIGCRGLLVTVCAIAFCGKARSGTSFRSFADSLRDLGLATVPGRLAVAVTVLAAEAAVAALLAVPATVRPGFEAGSALLGVLTLGAWLAVARGQTVRCQCFGADAGPIGVVQLVRNCVLTGIAIIGTASAAAGPGGGPGHPGPAAVTVSAGLGGLAGLLMTGWDELAFLLRPMPGLGSR